MNPHFDLTDTSIDSNAVRMQFANAQTGGFVSFEGWVRNHNEGKMVSHLEYEVYTALALKEGESIVAEAIKKYDLVHAYAIHRHGLLHIGDTAVWVGASAAHRDEAFKACRLIIDQIKVRLPIWKCEHYLDGKREWVLCSHPNTESTHHSHPHIH